MSVLSRSHLSDPALLSVLAADLAREREATAQVLVDLAEVDARRLYLPAGHPSMFEFCVRELRFPREKAYKRIRAARAARRFPAIVELVAAGRLSVTSVVVLAAHLTEHTASDLLAAAADRTAEEIERLLAARFPRPDLPERIEPSPGPADALAPPEAPAGPTPVATASGNELSLRTVDAAAPVPAAPVTDHELSLRTVAAPEPRARVMPLAPERFAIQCTVGRHTHENLRRAQDLLRHQAPDGSLETVLDRALELLVRELEKRRCAATARPRTAPGAPRAASARPGSRSDPNPRHIPAHVRREVWKRDGGRCTFVSATGRRCEARGHLELDHEHPVARGGRSTIGNLRLRCRAHNQYEAERVYGEAFMRRKREERRSEPVARSGAPALPAGQRTG